MPRKRFVSPGFFTNEDLASCPALARIAFVGLLCHADRDGRLEDRPARLKALILPYDDCDFEGLLDRLHSGHFILRYQVSGLKLIAVPNFLKYQSPHPREPQSVLPPPPMAAGGAPVARNGPGSTNSNMPEKDKNLRSQEDPEGKEGKEDATYSKAFEEWYEVYPRHRAKHKASAAYGRAVDRIAQAKGEPKPQARSWLLASTTLYAASPAGHAGQFVPYPATWLNAGSYDDDPAEWQRSGEAPKPDEQFNLGKAMRELNP